MAQKRAVVIAKRVIQPHGKYLEIGLERKDANIIRETNRLCFVCWLVNACCAGGLRQQSGDCPAGKHGTAAELRPAARESMTIFCAEVGERWSDRSAWLL